MQYDLIIIGAGPAGYVAAIRAGQVGLKTAIIEKEHVGGMCLNWGCIPSKALLESAKLYKKVTKEGARFGIEGFDKKAMTFNYSKAVKRASGIVTKLTKGVGFLLQKNGVDVIEGTATITGPTTVSVDNRALEARNIIIATGSKSPVIAGDENVIVDLKNLFTDREIPENIVIAGGNSVAVELAQFFNMIGKKVTLVAEGDRIMPKADPFISKYMQNLIKKEKVKIIYDNTIESIEGKLNDGQLTIGEESVACDMLINANTRKGIVPEMKVTVNQKDSFIQVDKDCRSSVPSIWAIGDVNGESYYAHIGSAQGLHVVNKIKGIETELDISRYPMNMYTVPEIAQIGQTEDQLKAAEVDYKISEFPMSANGKAMAEGETDGFVRILSENKYGEVMGVQIVAPNATDMIAEASAFMQLESTVYDIAKTVHAHPTISEVFMEAGFEAVDGAIHK
jgi:dihydrolipoamide dehydrogenase